MMRKRKYLLSFTTELKMILLSFAFVFFVSFLFCGLSSFLHEFKMGQSVVVERGRKFSESRTLPSGLNCLTSSQMQQVAKQYNTFVTYNGIK